MQFDAASATTPLLRLAATDKEGAHVETLLKLVDRFHQTNAPSPATVTTLNYWHPPAKTFTYHTHIAVPSVKRATLDIVADTFFGAADLRRQPWYAQFQFGESRALDHAPPAGILRHQLAISTFEVGLKAPRCYRQLVVDSAPRDDTRVVSLVSVDVDWEIPEGAVLAMTLEPSGDVFEWRGGALHWHHICTTPGVGLLPGALDRWLLNSLRRLRLDSAERRTYRDEAESFLRWVTTELRPS